MTIKKMDEEMWQCACGSVEFGEIPPEECDKCWEVNSFSRVPEDMKEQLGDLILEDIKPGEFDDEE